MRLPSTSALCCLCAALLTQLVLADTEIRNFRLPLPPASLTAGNVGTRYKLDSSTRQLTLSVSSSQPELSVLLTPEEDYMDWTIRLSWPGSSPTRFDLSLRPLNSTIPGDHSALLLISASPLSVPIPISPIRHPVLSHLASLLHPAPDASRGLAKIADIGTEEWETTFHLVFEPLILGVLPRTAIPAVLLILVFGGGAACCVPSIIRLLERTHRGAEAAGEGERKDQ